MRAQFLSRWEMVGLVVLSLVVVGGVVWRTTQRGPIPSYGGKSVRTWIEEIRTQERFGMPQHGAGRAAIEALGPAAVPYLLDSLDRRPIPFWERFHRAAYRRFPSVLPGPPLRLEGSDALSYQNFVVRSCRQTFPQALELLVEATESDRVQVRETAVYTLAGSVSHSPAIVSALVRGLEDEDGRVRFHAALGLGRFGPAASNAVPFLVKALQPARAERAAIAARALGLIGPGAREAVPSLRPLLASTNVQDCVNAAIALWQITGDSSESIPVLVQKLEQKLEGFDRLLELEIFQRLQEMGTNVQNSIPRSRLILRSLLSADDESASLG